MLLAHITRGEIGTVLAAFVAGLFAGAVALRSLWRRRGRPARPPAEAE
jgi:hypothetical protein